jgi:hypothetical protein
MFSRPKRWPTVRSPFGRSASTVGLGHQPEAARVRDAVGPWRGQTVGRITSDNAPGSPVPHDRRSPALPPEPGGVPPAPEITSPVDLQDLQDGQGQHAVVRCGAVDIEQ